MCDSGTCPIGVEEYNSGVAQAESSTDGVLRLGNIVPDFNADTTRGVMHSFHKWKANKWCVLFSHPADFTPVCTTEVGAFARNYKKFQRMNCKVAALSVDPVETHIKWLHDVVAHAPDKISIDFPIICDMTHDISMSYGMIDPGNSDDDLPLTIRSVFFIDPDNKLMLSLNYPACVGRNMAEILRCVQALQLSYKKSIATPANWPNNHDEVILKDGTKSTAFKGSVFLLPTVSHEDATAEYPDHLTCEVPSNMNYLRLVKPGDVGVEIKADGSVRSPSSSSSSSSSGKKKKKSSDESGSGSSNGSSRRASTCSTSSTKSCDSVDSSSLDSAGEEGKQAYNRRGSFANRGNGKDKIKDKVDPTRGVARKLSGGLVGLFIGNKTQ